MVKENDTTAPEITDSVATEVNDVEQQRAARKAESEAVSASLAPAETVAERFVAARSMVFLAPDVPPVMPRARRSNDRRGLPPGFEEDDLAQTDSSRRRTRNRRGGDDLQSRDEVVGESRGTRDRAPLITEPQRIKGSTRLEAKKQRRRDGREAGRKRTVVTESEFLARREAVDRMMVVRQKDDRIQIGVLEDSVLVEHYVARSSEVSLIGNVYLGRVQNVLPSMEAAFVDIGRGRNAVLYSGEVDWSELDGGNTARKIEHVLNPGDQVLVQVTKDPVGHKGARLTSQVSLPGRYLVYVPNGSMNGISRKLPDTERVRLKKILKEILPENAGVIVRTAAEGATEEQLTLDVARLTKQWDSIQAAVEKGNAPAMLHSEPDMLIKIVRDVFNEDFQKILISGAETFSVITDYLAQVAPDLQDRVEQYTDTEDVFDKYRISEQIVKALDRKVWLPSGGSLVIDRTEAMTVVDVNTGKFVGSGGNLEETVTKNNLEAAEEIVRQLRLRDIGGIIVVDFIDMVLESNRDLVLRRMVECLSRDRTKHQVAEVTSLGLVQMTRKKLGLGLIESFSEQCETCAGRGILIYHDPVFKHTQTPQDAPKRRRAAKPSQTQPHAITDESKNMLATIAASTIQKSDDDVDDAVKGSEEQDASSASKSSGRARTKKSATSVDEGIAAVTELLGQPLPEAHLEVTAHPEHGNVDELLGSVLDALPEAPATRAKSRSRRVSSPASNEV